MNRYHQLLARNKGRGEFRAAASGDCATIYLYDAIVDSADEAEWYGGVDPLAFIAELKKITAKTIHLRVNSPGGSVFAARAMEQALREHPAEIVAHVDGLAASAASFLIMAADRIEMAKGAFLMIHKAWTIAWGNSDELTKTAALLEKIDGTLVQTYADKSGAEAATIAAWMADETWFTAAEALDAGLVDAIAEASPQAKAWDLSAYEHAPQQAAAPQENTDRRAHRDRAAAFLL